MGVAIGLHKTMVREELADLDLEANIDPLWDQQRAISGSDDDCALRVIRVILGQEARKLRRRFDRQEPPITADEFNARMSEYRFAVQNVKDRLVDLASGVGIMADYIAATAPVEYPGLPYVDANATYLRGDPYSRGPYPFGWR